MRYSESEIVEDVLEHIRQCGGESGRWCVGTARDSQSPLFRRHAAEDSGFLYRETYTIYAAAEVLDRLRDLGLRPDPDAASQPGKIVFVYRAGLKDQRVATACSSCRGFGELLR